MKKSIKKLTLSSILSALITVLIIIGSVIELLDITVAAVCSLVVYISMYECKGKYPYLVYSVSSILCLIFASMTTATLYYVAFFGYYPILRYSLRNLSSKLRKLICALIFNIIMAVLMLTFKALFGLQGEPYGIYFALLLTVNIFFFCFDRLLDLFYIIYIKYIRSKINFKF